MRGQGDGRSIGAIHRPFQKQSAGESPQRLGLCSRKVRKFKSRRVSGHKTLEQVWRVRWVLATFGGVKERRAYKIYWLEDWRREKLAGVPWEIRMIRITGIVWVPVAGLTAAVLIKVFLYALIRVVAAGFGWILRVLFH
jgi:hypothetical protein